jgi:hypothetical protein
MLGSDDFVIMPVAGGIVEPLAPVAKDPLRPLSKLDGTWNGSGFNQIWRRFDGLLRAVASLANIPRTTSLFSEGIAVSNDIDPVFPEISITPFKIPPPHKPIQLPWTNLATPAKFRTPPADNSHVRQAMVDIPNPVLVNGIAAISVTELTISTMNLNQPFSGGGVQYRLRAGPKCSPGADGCVALD